MNNKFRRDVSRTHLTIALLLTINFGGEEKGCLVEKAKKSPDSVRQRNGGEEDFRLQGIFLASE